MKLLQFPILSVWALSCTLASVSPTSARLLQDACDDEPLDFFSVRGTYLCACESTPETGPVTTCEHRCDVCHIESGACFATNVVFSVNPVAPPSFRRSVVTFEFNQGLEGNVTLVTDYVSEFVKTCTVSVNGDSDVCSCLEGEDCYTVNCNQGSSIVGTTTYDGCSGNFEGPPIPLLLDTPMFASNFTFQNCESAAPTQSPTASPTQSAIQVACDANRAECGKLCQIGLRLLLHGIRQDQYGGLFSGL